MRRTTATIAGLVLVAGLAGCGQDSREETNAEFCTAITALQTEVDTFNALVQAGTDFDELQVQAQAVVAASKEVSAVTQRLDERPKNEMNAASEQLGHRGRGHRRRGSDPDGVRRGRQGRSGCLRGHGHGGRGSGGLHDRLILCPADAGGLADELANSLERPRRVGVGRGR